MWTATILVQEHTQTVSSVARRRLSRKSYSSALVRRPAQRHDQQQQQRRFPFRWDGTVHVTCCRADLGVRQSSATFSSFAVSSSISERYRVAALTQLSCRMQSTSNISLPTVTTAVKPNLHWRIWQTLVQHVWPSISDDMTQEKKEAIELRKHRVVMSLGLLVAGKVVTLQVPYIFKNLVDGLPVLVESASTTLLSDPAGTGLPMAGWLVAYGVSRAASSGLQEWRNAVFAHVAQDAIRATGRSVLDHVLKLDLQFHLTKNTGQVARVLDRGQRSIQMVLTAMTFHMVPTLLEMSLVSGLLAYQCSTAHAGVAALTAVSYVGFTVGITQWRTKFRRDMNRLENQASSRVVDALVNYETVQYFNNNAHEGQRYEVSLKGYQQAALQSQYSLSLLNFGQAAIFSGGLTSLMWLTGQQVLEGTATVGDLVLVNGLFFQLSVPLYFIGSVYREVRQALIDMENMYQLMDTPPAIASKSNAREYQPATMGTDLALESVDFSYPSMEAPTDANDKDPTAPDAIVARTSHRSILQNCSIHIPQGSTVALVGSSGGGKSTLLRLWYRYFDANQGRVSVGGQDVQDMDVESLRRQIAVIPQETVLFHESILYNLQYGNWNATREQVEEAAQLAHLHDTIQNFPDGYDTVVGERGLKLSGGEKQRVAIARAILKGAPILLCDEPTSSLDNETETHILQEIQQLRNHRPNLTTVMIAHRLSTVQNCDQIYVLNQGQVVEQGTHEELLDRNGRYTELLRQQRAQTESGEE